MKTVADLLEFLALPDELSEKVQRHLASFQALPDVTNEQRQHAAETVFSAVFGHAILKTNSKFGQYRESTWSTSCQLSPTLIVLPETAADVSKVLALCRFLDIKFSVRGGGHHHNPGFNSNSGGVLISMKQFRDIELSQDKATAEIGFGLTWLEVYRQLDPFGLTVTGGRVPSVGVAGLLLGGGLSFQNSEHGLSCNNVVEYEVVLADLTIVRASATENEDLFWALKGGGPNFGVVTKAKMKTVSNQVWAEGRIYSPETNGQLFDAIMKFHEAAEHDAKASVIVQSIHEATIVVLFYCAPVDNPPVFRCFDDLPFVAHIVQPRCQTVYEVLNGFAQLNAGEPKGHDMRTMTSLPDLGVYQAAEEERLKQLEVIKDIPGGVIAMVIQPIASGTVTASHEKGGNPLGLVAKPHQWFLIRTDWSNPEDEEVMREASRKIVERAEAVARQNGTHLDFKYSNYASRDQNPLASYGSVNMEKLKAIARRYDPEGVFQQLQYGGWLITRTGEYVPPIPVSDGQGERGYQ